MGSHLFHSKIFVKNVIIFETIPVCHVSGVLHSSLPSRDRILYNTLNIFNPEHVHHSLYPQNSEGKAISAVEVINKINLLIYTWCFGLYWLNFTLETLLKSLDI